MTTERMRNWVLVMLVAASMVACSKAAEDDEGDGNNDPPANQAGAGGGDGDGDGDTGGDGDGDGDGDTSAAGTGAAGDDGNVVPGAGTGGDGDGDTAGTGGDGDGDGDGDADCDANPHQPACIDTHVRGKCDIDSGYPGDDTCLLPPPPGQGIQIHVGPADYDNPELVEVHVLNADTETTQCFGVESPNDEDVYYQGWVFSGRPGTHHIINTGYMTAHPAGVLGAFGTCRTDSANVGPRVPGAAKAYMPRLPVAPENEGVATLMAAHTAIISDMHYFNFTQEPILREYWMNLYTIPADQVKETSNRIRGYGGLGFNITPGTDQVFPYSCPITADGRILTMLGHTHAHAVRFTAWLNRNTATERKIFETYDYQEPKVYAFNTVEVNPPFSDNAPGAHTGVLDVKNGDTLDWECHVINDSEATLRYTNHVNTGEMCNIWGESLGPLIDCNRF